MPHGAKLLACTVDRFRHPGGCRSTWPIVKSQFSILHVNLSEACKLRVRHPNIFLSWPSLPLHLHPFPLSNSLAPFSNLLIVLHSAQASSRTKQPQSSSPVHLISVPTTIVHLNSIRLSNGELTPQIFLFHKLFLYCQWITVSSNERSRKRFGRCWHGFTISSTGVV